MKIASKVTDRKQLVKALEEATGMKGRYLFSPSFAYEVGPYTVDRSGALVVNDADASEEVIRTLEAKELIERTEEIDTEDTVTMITLPIAEHNGRSLKNLVFMLHSKSVLLGKAVGRLGWYRVSDKLIADLDAHTPESADDFLKILQDAGEDALQGLSFEDGKIGFIFPYTKEPDHLHTYMQLTTLMVNAAKEQHRVQPEKCKITNEKYTFRVWLMRLGMKGEEYKTARKLLLQNLKGHAAFRTKDQEEAAREKLKKQRADAKEAAGELAFEEL